MEGMGSFLIWFLLMPWTPAIVQVGPPEAASLDPNPLLQAFLQHQWKLAALLFASLTVGLFVRLLKDDTWFPTIPKQWRALAAFGFGIAGGVLAHVLAGVGWGEAIGGGMVAAWGAIFGHVTLIEGLRSGAEIPMPAWLRKAPEAPPPPSSPSNKDVS
jgi:hypothetical protein